MGNYRTGYAQTLDLELSEMYLKQLYLLCLRSDVDLKNQMEFQMKNNNNQSFESEWTCLAQYTCQEREWTNWKQLSIIKHTQKKTECIQEKERNSVRMFNVCLIRVLEKRRG